VVERVKMDRRSFLKGLVATAAGVLVPGAVLAEPERRVWALDQTMVQPKLPLDIGIDPGYDEAVVFETISLSRRYSHRHDMGPYYPGAWIQIGDEHMQVVGHKETQGWYDTIVVARFPSSA
jgi:hypothetical protein